MRTWLERLLAYRQLTIGLVIIGAVVLLGLVGPLLVDTNRPLLNVASTSDPPPFGWTLTDQHTPPRRCVHVAPPLVDRYNPCVVAP